MGLSDDRGAEIARRDDLTHWLISTQDPTSVKALFRQGKCYLALDKWDAAKESFRKVLELDDGNMEARRGLQSVRLKQQQQKEKEKKLYAGKKLFDGKDRPAPKKAPPASSCCDASAPDGSCCPPPPPEASAEQ